MMKLYPGKQKAGLFVSVVAEDRPRREGKPQQKAMATDRQRELIRILWCRYQGKAVSLSHYMDGICGCRLLELLDGRKADDVIRQLRYDLGLPREGGTENQLVGWLWMCRILWSVHAKKHRTGDVGNPAALSEWVREYFDIPQMERAEPHELHRVVAALKTLAK